MTEAGTWRVVLTRVPATADAHAVVDAICGSAKGGLPRVMGLPLSWEAAVALLEQLRAIGAEVALVPSASTCGFHPADIASGQCGVCHSTICAECRASALGQRVCPNCLRTANRVRRNRRLRQLFVGFLFAVFLFEVATFLRREAAALTPPVSVVIVQLAPQRLLAHPVLREMNQPDEGAGRSLYDISMFFQQEFTRYTGSTAPILNISLRGPFPEIVKPPVVLERASTWFRMALTAWQYPRYFHGLARRHRVEPDDFGARMYVVWTDSAADVVGDSRGSQKGRVGVTWLSVGEANLGYSVVSVAHELAHILGAVDSYDEGSYLAHWPEGYVDPFAIPLWPQAWAELMAVDRPTGPLAELEVTSMFDTRIGYDTAARIGWIAGEQAEFYYQPRLQMPEQILHEIEEARRRVGVAQSLGAAAEAPAIPPEPVPLDVVP
ncbi:MAG: hypothetical protein EXR69_08240, partial [Myxococcales bacterium]|nr:hypothetical protein [Myxococcales bacterium]